MCASVAAGSVCSAAGRAVIDEVVVERGFFSRATPAATSIDTAHGRYHPVPCPGDAPDDINLAIHRMMTALESRIAARHDADLVVFDGPLRQRTDRHAIGYVKTQHVQYLPDELQVVVGRLGVGERTPLFLLEGPAARYSWYLRLPGPRAQPLSGVVRVEVPALGGVTDVVARADAVTRTLPRFASEAHKDPRAPQNLYPIAGLEQRLRHLLGDQLVIERGPTPSRHRHLIRRRGRATFRACQPCSSARPPSATRRTATAPPCSCWPPAGCAPRASRRGATRRGTRSLRCATASGSSPWTSATPGRRSPRSPPPTAGTTTPPTSSALMDHLGIDRFAVVGMCIGGAFIAKLLVTVPERVSAAVAMQPIGLDDNRDTFDELYAAWRDDVRADHPEASDADWSAVQDNLFGREDYLWSVPDADVAAIDRPLLVLRGNDQYHPAATSERMAAEVPGARLIHTWKEGDAVAAAESEVDAFLDAHTP